jgi:5,10-methylene-tetrahydrofolate dehydrogenase/methenyl tetrahydrofolate cyclohydrolase
MLWYMPVFMHWQNEQVQESGIDARVYELAANRIQEQIERILGVP